MHKIAAFQKTRIAPTPSGFLHLGNLLSFSITALLAGHAGANVLLRIDDMDTDRIRAAYVEDVFETLQFLGIPWHEGPRNRLQFEEKYSQRHRLDHYHTALNELRDRGLIYACNCSRSQILRAGTAGYPGTCRHLGIPPDTPGVAWRLKTDAREQIQVRNITGSITSATLPPEMLDVIVRKKDGLPAYQLTSMIDDVLFGVDLVVRGHDLWHSTLAQLYMARLLGKSSFLNATFCHHFLLRDHDQRKLSKSAGAASLHNLRRQGASPEEVYARLGQQLQMSPLPAGFTDFEAALPRLIL